MAINRGPFNALVDDDGTDLTGSMWNKAAIASVILDPADAAYANKYDTAILNAASGVQNPWAPGFNGHTFVQWTGTSDLTVVGITGGVAGQRVTIRHSSGTTAVISFVQNSGAASVGTRLSNLTTSGPTPITTNGWITYQYDGTFWCLVAHEQGAWITPPFNASNYSSDTTWNVTGVNNASYRLAGKTLHWNQEGVAGSTVGTAASILYIKLPSTYTGVRDTRAMCLVAASGVFHSAHAFMFASGASNARVQIQSHDPGSGGVTSFPVGLCYVYGLQMAIEVA